MELYSRHSTALGNGRQAIMERLNEIMGRTMPRRPSNPVQQSQSYQGQHLASQSPQAEPTPQPLARRRLSEQALQSLPPDSSTRPDAPYPYGDGTPSRPNQQHSSNAVGNQRQSYVQETSHNRSNVPSNYTSSYREQDESEAQTSTRGTYRHNRSTMYPSTDRRNEMNDGEVMYSQNAQISTQHRQNHPSSQSRQEQYFHHADVNHHINQPEADVLNQDEMEDDEDLHMGYGDWEEESNQIRVSRRSDVASRAQTRRLTSVHEANPAYIERPTQSIQPLSSSRPTRNLRDMRNEADHNKRPISSYRTQQSTTQPRSVQQSQPYSGQQPAVQPTTYTSQVMSIQSVRQERQGQSQPPHLVTSEQEAPYVQRTTQPLNPQTITDLSRQRELALQLNQARMRLTETPQQVQTLPQPERKETQTVARLRPVQPTRQVSQSPSVQSQPSTFVTNKSLCTKCNGAGYLRANVPFGHPNFGKAIACECKEAERKEKRRQQLREMSNLDAF